MDFREISEIFQEVSDDFRVSEALQGRFRGLRRVVVVLRESKEYPEVYGGSQETPNDCQGVPEALQKRFRGFCKVSIALHGVYVRFRGFSLLILEEVSEDFQRVLAALQVLYKGLR